MNGWMNECIHGCCCSRCLLPLSVCLVLFVCFESSKDTAAQFISNRSARKPIEAQRYAHSHLQRSALTELAFAVVRAHINTYIRTHVHTYTRTYVHTYIRTHVHTYTRTYVHTYTRTYVHTYIRTHVHTYTRTYVHTYTHTSIHPSIRTETEKRAAYTQQCLAGQGKTHPNITLHVEREREREVCVCMYVCMYVYTWYASFLCRPKARNGRLAHSQPAMIIKECTYA